MKLECPGCGNIWNYKGNHDHYASCSNCKSSVKIEKHKVKA